MQHREFSRNHSGTFFTHHFIIFRGQLKDTSQLGIHEIIRLCIFPLVKKEKMGMLFISSPCQQLHSIHRHMHAYMGFKKLDSVQMNIFQH